MSDPLSVLVQRLSRLPGIGEKTATRLAFHILRAPEEHARELSQAILDIKHRLRPCTVCFNLTEQDPCGLCSDPRRDGNVICVVSQPQDLLAIERSGSFRGRYHVLGGVLSPLDGVGPDDLQIQPLLQRLGQGQVQELILATSPNVEGDATALYLARLVKPMGIAVSRIASGIPIGGDLEYADGVTLNRALESRRTI
jgi:recombination protein RecR